VIHIIWDLDGTLIDSDREIKLSIEYALKKSGLDLSKQIKPIIVGPTIDKILLESFPSDIMTDALLEDIIIAFREIYDNSNYEQTKPFPGIESIIFSTDKFVHHIVTNKPDMPTNRILDKLNWSKYIASVTTPYTNSSAFNGKKRSKYEIFMDIITESNTAVSSFIGIGDMKTDCLAAEQNNITAVGVLWGSGTRDELSDCCDYLFEDAKQLHDFLYEISMHKRLA